jgi:hypothetical protein
MHDQVSMEKIASHRTKNPALPHMRGGAGFFA